MRSLEKDVSGKPYPRQHATTYLKQKENSVNYRNNSPSLIYAESMTHSIACLQIPNYPELRSDYAAAMMHSIACLQIPVIVASGPYTCGGFFKTQSAHICGLLTMIRNYQQQTVEYSFSHLFSELKAFHQKVFQYA